MSGAASRSSASGWSDFVVLDQVAVDALAVADRRLEADGILDRGSSSSCTRSGVKPASLAISSIVGSRFSFWARMRGARAARWRTCSATWTGRRIVRPWSASARVIGLADPPGRVRRELVAQLVVELLDRADQAEVALLDQVEQRDAGLRVVPRDRHHEAQVRTRSGGASRPRRPRPCARASSRSSGGVSSAAVADLADVELERILRDRGDRVVRVLLLDLDGLVELRRLRNDLELGSSGVGSSSAGS